MVIKLLYSHFIFALLLMFLTEVSYVYASDSGSEPFRLSQKVLKEEKLETLLEKKKRQKKAPEQAVAKEKPDKNHTKNTRKIRKIEEKLKALKQTENTTDKLAPAPEEQALASMKEPSGSDKKPKEKNYDGYILGAGDKVKITVFGEEELSGDFIVNNAGQISFPLIGEVDVEGLKVLKARDRISSLLKQGYLKNPSIAIEVTGFRPFYILGEVRQPGSYSFITNMTVLNAVALAGGFTFRAEQDEVDILRTLESGPVFLEDVGSNHRIVPEDVILIKERFF